MFGIDIPSWLTLELIGVIIIFIGVVLAALTFYLKRKQSAEEKAEKDMEEIYRPLFEEINKLLERKELLRKSPTSPYLPYIAPYKKIYRLGKVNPETHKELRKDMKDLIGRIKEEDKDFNILLDKLEPLCKRTSESIQVTTQGGKILSLHDWHHLRIDKYDIIYGNREEWGTNFDNQIKELEDTPEVDIVELKVTGKAIFDQLFSQIKSEREDAFSKKNEIFAKAKEIKKKLDYKTTYPMKRYGDQ